MIRLCKLSSAALLVATASAPAADWSQWRGPGRNGLVEEGPALVSSLAGQAPLWQSEPITAGDSGGRGSLVVHAGRVYGLTSVTSGSSTTDEVFCLNADSGKAVAKSRLRESGTGGAGSSTPCIAGGKLYVVGSGGGVSCLHADDGRPVWERKLSRSANRPVASSVAVAGKIAVLLADVLTGLDARTGEVLWTQERVAGQESS